MTINNYQKYDIIIVGAGVVGCAAARAFGQDGRKVLLLERDLSEPDRIVGELMQPGGMHALRKLGMEDCVEGIEAIDCYGYSIYRHGELLDLPYTQSKGYSFHHGRFIQNLRKSATNTKNVTVKQVTVTDFIQDQDKVIGVCANDLKFYAPLTLVADGIFSKFRKEFTCTKTKVMSHFVGFLLHDFKLPFPQKGFVAIAHPSPILMYQIGPHDTRVLVDVPGAKLPCTEELKHYMMDVVCPQLPKYMHDTFLKALETERLRPMPSGFLPPNAEPKNGTILLGDALNVRSPLTGGGMTVALQDVLTCRDLLSPENIPTFQNNTDVILQAMQSFYWKRKRYSAVINVLAMSLYSVFSAQSEAMMVIQKGCFEYLRFCSDGPMDLLAGMNHNPLVLIYHFYRVAMLAIYVMFQEGGIRQLPQNFLRAFLVFYTASYTILPFLWGEL